MIRTAKFIFCTKVQSVHTHKEQQTMIDNIIAYEQGELDEDEVIAMFQELVNSGLAW